MEYNPTQLRRGVERFLRAAIIRRHRAPKRAQWFNPSMSIDKDSNGALEVNVHRRTTKVNLWMIAAVVFFLAIMAVAAVLISRSS